MHYPKRALESLHNLPMPSTRCARLENRQDRLRGQLLPLDEQHLDALIGGRDGVLVAGHEAGAVPGARGTPRAICIIRMRILNSRRNLESTLCI